MWGIHCTLRHKQSSPDRPETWHERHMRILTQHDISAIVDRVSVDELLACSQRALVASSQNRCQCPPHLSVTNANFTSLHMPSELDNVICEKVVCVPRTGTGLPASIQVLNAQTGQLECVMNAAVLTALRTAAASLLATKQVIKARGSRPATLCVFGTGEQAFQHVRLHVKAIPTLNRVTVVTRTKNESYDKFMARLQQVPEVRGRQGLELVGTTDGMDDRVGQADIICCCTPSTTPLVTYKHLLLSVDKARHINLIGSYKPTMHELDTEAMLASELVMTDSTEDCMRESGELIDAVTAGLDMAKVSELGKVLDGTLNLRETSLTVFKCVGMSVMDNAIAQVILAKAEELQLGTIIDEF